MRLRDETGMQPRHQAAVQQRGGQGAQAVQQTGTRHFLSFCLLNLSLIFRSAILALLTSVLPSLRGCPGQFPASSAALPTFRSAARTIATTTINHYIKAFM